MPKAALCKLLSGRCHSLFRPLRTGSSTGWYMPVGGQRIVGFDNERGKGDHRHQGDEEFPYKFRGVAQLLEDFVAEVTKWRA